MAKTRHNNILDTIDELFTNAKDRGVMHLSADNTEFSGRFLTINNRELVNFGTLGYMALDQHPLLKEASIEAVRQFGTQFSASRAFISLKICEELEDKLSAIFERPVLASTTSTSLGHLGVIPSIVRDDDAIILDHQVHASIQNAVKVVQVKGVPVEMIRHNNMNMLEDTIKTLGQKYRKIWYMIDGVYSMYGDLPPIKELYALLDKYEQLHLYVDDAHGVSWAGKHGRGYILSQVESHPKVILTATMGKGFGSAGGIFTFPDSDMCRKVRTFGGALSFSVPSPPAVMAASLASAKLHLSDEFSLMQNELKDLIQYCNDLIDESSLPTLHKNETPIFFIPVGTPSTGYNFAKRLMNEGYFVNLAIFPAVPVKNTGIRFSVSRNVNKADIKGLIDAMNHHFLKALEEEGETLIKVKKAFNLLPPDAEESNNMHSDKIVVKQVNTITDVDREEWNELLGDRGGFEWEMLKVIEESNKEAEKRREEYKWDFYYFIAKDTKGVPIVATLFTRALAKDDMLAPAAVSVELEEARKENFYYLTSYAVTLGTFLTEGNPLYVNLNHPEWKHAMDILFDNMSKVSDINKDQSIILRDFEEDNVELREYFTNKGFVKVDVPESCIVTKLDWNTEEEYLQFLSPRSRRHTRNDVIKYKHFYDVEFRNELSKEELEWAIALHKNVKARNYDLNTFEYPTEFFEKMQGHPDFEFIILKLKPEYDLREEKKPIGVIFSYKNHKGQYCPMIVGMDYEYRDKYNLYRQCLYQAIERGRMLGFKQINLGLSAEVEKRKVGATIIPKVAYMQFRDNYIVEWLGQRMIK